MLVIFTILLVWDTSSLIKSLLFVMLFAFLFPIMRGVLSKDRFRKIKTAFYTSIIFSIGVFLFSFVTAIFEGDPYVIDGRLYQYIIVVFTFSLLGNFIYGLPASLIAELISKKFAAFRFWLSGLIHIGFGLVTYFIFPGFSIPAVCCSVIFFIVDEKMRRDY